MMRSVVLLMMTVLMLGGCASGTLIGAGQGGRAADGRSYEDARADALITSAVNKLLVRDGQVRAMDVTVSTREGVVFLDGQVESADMVQRAEQLARQVDGVKGVVNRLRVER